jgi:hypothetical protein
MAQNWFEFQPNIFYCDVNRRHVYRRVKNIEKREKWAEKIIHAVSIFCATALSKLTLKLTHFVIQPAAQWVLNPVKLIKLEAEHSYIMQRSIKGGALPSRPPYSIAMWGAGLGRNLHSLLVGSPLSSDSCVCMTVPFTENLVFVLSCVGCFVLLVFLAQNFVNSNVIVWTTDGLTNTNVL